MTVGERVERYVRRGFDREQAEVLMLMEESAIALFSRLPDHFVLFGGATLVLFHNSPRLSKDLDLLVQADHSPSVEELTEALEERVQEVAGIFGLGPVNFEPEPASTGFLRLWIVGSRKQRLFTVDLTRIGGSVITREIVEENIAGDEERTRIPAASRNYLLLQKAESFVSRRVVKARDAFDIHLLREQGATLDQGLKAHLSDALLWREIDREQIEERIVQVTPKLCRAELQSVLPAKIYETLQKNNFEILRVAVRQLFSEQL